jgi:hypothetical protein
VPRSGAPGEGPRPRSVLGPHLIALRAICPLPTITQSPRLFCRTRHGWAAATNLFSSEIRFVPFGHGRSRKFNGSHTRNARFSVAYGRASAQFRCCLTRPSHPLTGAPSRPTRSTAALASAKCRGSIRAALHAMQRAGVTRKGRGKRSHSRDAFASELCASQSSRLSEAPRAPVVMPAGSMPGPPESGSDEPPPAGTAPAPSVGVTG